MTDVTEFIDEKGRNVDPVVLLSPQPDHAPFRIGGDTSGNWYNERRAYRRGGNYLEDSVMLIHWTPPAPGMIPVCNITTGHKWAWQNAQVEFQEGSAAE